MTSPDIGKSNKRTPPKLSGLLRSGAVVPSESKLAQPDEPYTPPRATHGLPEGDVILQQPGTPASHDKIEVTPALLPIGEEKFRSNNGTTGVEELQIPVDLIDISPFQPRIQIDEQAITELGMSIAAEGQINSIIVRPVNGRYELIGGERRWRAVQTLGLKTIRAVVRHLSDDETALMALVDNDAREDLTDYERALRYKYMLDQKLAKSAADLARRVGKKELDISRCLAFHKLPQEVVPLLTQRPAFLSARAAGDFARYMASNDADLVTVAINKVFDEKLDILSALNWLKSEHRARHTPSAPVMKQEFHSGGRLLGEIRIDGRKVVITCSAGVTPDELVNTIILNTGKSVEGSLSNG